MKQRLRVAIIVVLSGIGHATFAQSTQPDSSNLSAKDTRARALVVKIEAKWTPDRSRQTGASAEVGAGFIIAVSRDAIFVATARHVVTQEADGPGKSTLLYVADSVLVTLSESALPRLARVVNIDKDHLLGHRCLT